VLGTQDLLTDRQQRGILVARGGRITGFPGPAGQVGAGEQSVRVRGAEDPKGRQPANAGSPAAPRASSIILRTVSSLVRPPAVGLSP
jgi:hypothetical protein